jgi:transcriptional regulator GlxA family with amidase domain
MKGRLRKLFHLSPGQYVMKVRIQALADTHHAITAIAGDVGFCDQAALSRHFKQVVGLSPAASRRWIRSKGQVMALGGRLPSTGPRIGL